MKENFRYPLSEVFLKFKEINMMEENNLKWLHLFQKILKPGCSFRDYIEFMATVNPNSKGLDIKSRQAVTILSKKKETAFQETDEGFVKLSTLEKSPEAAENNS